MNTKTEEVEEQIKLSPQELKTLENDRMVTGIKKQCAGEIDLVLKKYNARIIVNPRSPIGNPDIIVVLN